MKKAEFQSRFEAAEAYCVSMTRTMVIENLPPIWMYSINLAVQKKSADLKWDEKHFHAFDLFAGRTTHPHDKSWFLGVLCQNGYVPRWIDLSILTITEIHTIFCATISDVVTKYESDGNPYYTDRKLKPWAVKSPSLPPGWINPDKSGRFSIFRTQKNEG